MRAMDASDRAEGAVAMVSGITDLLPGLTDQVTVTIPDNIDSVNADVPVAQNYGEYIFVFVYYAHDGPSSSYKWVRTFPQYRSQNNRRHRRPWPWCLFTLPWCPSKITYTKGQIAGLNFLAWMPPCFALVPWQISAIWPCPFLFLFRALPIPLKFNPFSLETRPWISSEQ